jgi:hypothetical protein
MMKGLYADDVGFAMMKGLYPDDGPSEDIHVLV